VLVPGRARTASPQRGAGDRKPPFCWGRPPHQPPTHSYRPGIVRGVRNEGPIVESSSSREFDLLIHHFLACSINRSSHLRESLRIEGQAVVPLCRTQRFLDGCSSNAFWTAPFFASLVSQACRAAACVITNPICRAAVSHLIARTSRGSSCVPNPASRLAQDSLRRKATPTITEPIPIISE
jgi:hypothetical protein